VYFIEVFFGKYARCYFFIILRLASANALPICAKIFALPK
jgi:hypothetical protein